jgi:hypothetical protein
MIEERRSLPRWEVKKEAKVWIPLTQGFNHCIIEDMHLKGMCISFDKRLPHQKNIRLSFAIGDNYDFIKIEAEIPWKTQEQERYKYGLSFNSISETDKDKIYQYISNNCYNQFKNKWFA